MLHLSQNGLNPTRAQGRMPIGINQHCGISFNNTGAPGLRFAQRRVINPYQQSCTDDNYLLAEVPLRSKTYTTPPLCSRHQTMKTTQPGGQVLTGRTVDCWPA
jgi:hypothetical protein